MKVVEKRQGQPIPQKYPIETLAIHPVLYYSRTNHPETPIAESLLELNSSVFLHYR